jgi:hypothetical protein
MSESATMQGIYEELKSLREEVLFIKKHMFDPDTVMTTEEKKIFERSMKEFKEGKTISLASVKKKLGLCKYSV